MTIFGPCSRCGAVGDDAWPHPFGEPCPLAKEAHDGEQLRADELNRAYLRKLAAETEAAEAQRDAHLRVGMAGLDIGESLRNLFGGDGET